VYGSTLKQLQQDANSYGKLKNASLAHNKCTWNPLARRHLAAGMMQIPYALFTALKQLIPCVVAARLSLLLLTSNWKWKAFQNIDGLKMY
jgi:hypothetical protein